MPKAIPTHISKPASWVRPSSSSWRAERYSSAPGRPYGSLRPTARAAVSSDPIRLWRIGKAELSVRWVRLKRKAQMEEGFDPAETNRFFTDWRAYGLTRIDEWCSQETTFRAMLNGLWRGTEFYSHWSGDGPEEL